MNLDKKKELEFLKEKYIYLQKVLVIMVTVIVLSILKLWIRRNIVPKTVLIDDSPLKFLTFQNLKNNQNYEKTFQTFESNYSRVVGVDGGFIKNIPGVQIFNSTLNEPSDVLGKTWIRLGGDSDIALSQNKLFSIKGGFLGIPLMVTGFIVKSILDQAGLGDSQDVLVSLFSQIFKKKVKPNDGGIPKTIAFEVLKGAIPTILWNSRERMRSIIALVKNGFQKPKPSAILSSVKIFGFRGKVVGIIILISFLIFIYQRLLPTSIKEKIESDINSGFGFGSSLSSILLNNILSVYKNFNNYLIQEKEGKQQKIDKLEKQFEDCRTTLGNNAYESGRLSNYYENRIFDDVELSECRGNLTQSHNLLHALKKGALAPRDIDYIEFVPRDIKQPVFQHKIGGESVSVVIEPEKPAGSISSSWVD
jgi:hypothetical protein